MRQGRRTAMALTFAAAVGLVAASCGSDNSSSSSGGASTTAASAGSATTAAASAGGGATTTAAGGSGTCKSGTATVPPITKGTAQGQGKTIGMLYDITGRGDKSFNDAAAAGMDQAKTDYGITELESTPTATDGSDRPERIKNVVSANPAFVEAVGFLWGDALTASATANPNQKFGIIDSVAVDKAGAPLPNVRSMTFAANEGSFLVGAAAACASKSGKIGFIGGVDVQLIHSFETGFKAGVAAVNPKAVVTSKYITEPPDNTGFNDPTKGKAIADAMYSSGIDVVYAAAGGSGKGLFQSAAASGKKPGEVYAIGVDSDQYQTASPDEQPYILTSALKRVDVATYEAITDALNGKITGELKTYNLKNNGVGYAVSNKDINKYAGTLEALKQQIISGQIKVPDATS
jgi:basic membrane protein A